MAEMDNIEKLIHRLKLCNTLQAKRIIYELIDVASIDCKYIDKFKCKIDNIKYPQWSNLYKIMRSYLRLYKFDNYEYFSRYSSYLLDTINNRMVFENEIAHILPLEQRQLSAKFSNYNENRFQYYIRKLVRSCAQGEIVEDPYMKIIVQPDEDTIVNRDILIDTVRWLYRIIERKVYVEENIKFRKLMSYLQALHASMLIKLKTNIRIPYENFCGFRMCDLCWRFVAYSDEQHCRCELHSSKNNTREYQKASSICNIKPKRKGNKAINYITYRFIDEIRCIFRSYHSTELYYDERVKEVGSEEASSILQSIPVTRNRENLADLMRLLSRTRQYIEKQGGDPRKWESVLNTLDPPVKDEPEAYRLQRQWLHSALCRDPTPFQLNLAFCEAWLRLHNVKYSLAGRGGARPNTGGARPGAGRPRKSGKRKI